MKTVIFDMDGVLINSEDIYADIEKQIFLDLGLTPTDEIRKSFVGNKMHDSWAKMKKIYNFPQTVEEIVKREIAEYDYHIHNGGIERFDDAYQLMQTLYDSGYTIGVGTTSSKPEAIILLKNFGFDKFFKALITRDDVKNVKPAPDIYLKVANILDTKPENCVVIEDSKPGIGAANAANMKCIARRSIHNDDYTGAQIILSYLTDITQEMIESL